MFPRLLVFVLAVAALLLQAGAGETIENIVHLAAHGHTAHDAAHTAPGHDAGSEHGDAHSDLEHGCAGHVHVCPCCAHPVLGHAVFELAVPAAPDSSEHLTLAGASTGPEGTATLVFRPPIAG